MKRIYIVEDEPIISRTIKVALETNGFEVCGSSGKGKEALYDIAELKPDLVLLDITLAGEVDGIKVAEKIAEKSSVPFIFLTSLSDPETIDRVKQTKPAGYINKPFTVAGLRSTIEIVLFKQANKNKEEPQPNTDNALFVKSKNGLIKLKKEDILYFEAYDFYCFAHTSTGKILISKTLKYVESKLQDPSFLRTHRSYIINLSKVDKVHDGYVRINQKLIPVSKANKEKLLNSLSLL